MRRVAYMLLLVVLAASCGGGGGGAVLPEEPAAGGFRLLPGDVADGTPIPMRFTCDGADDSPALAWQGVPGGTEELALLVEDPDAPDGLFTHWLAYGLPADASSLPRAVPAGGEVTVPVPLRQGKNGFGQVGWGGPCPPRGDPAHHYVFRLLALDAKLDLAPASGRKAFVAAVTGHVLAEARLVATYARASG